MASDVLFDNLGTLSFPPQYSAQRCRQSGNPQPGDRTSRAVFPQEGWHPELQTDYAAARNTQQPSLTKVIPYAGTYTLTVQRVLQRDHTAEIGYVGTRGIHLPTQIQLNISQKSTRPTSLPLC
jgi:hypothetical protein